MMMFTMFFVVALAMGHTTHQLRAREAAERRREHRASALNRLLESVTASASLEDGLARAVKEVDALFRSRTAVLLATAEGRLDEAPHPTSTFSPDAKERAVAAWAFERGQAAGTIHRHAARRGRRCICRCRPRRTGSACWGFISRSGDTWTLDENDLLETFAGQIAVMIESYRAIETAQQARMAEESERLHRTLLDSVSHELKTPLAVIGAATEGLDTQLKDAGLPLSETFLDEIKAANRRLDRIVTNLLDMTRIESGRLPLNIEWAKCASCWNRRSARSRTRFRASACASRVPDNAAAGAAGFWVDGTGDLQSARERRGTQSRRGRRSRCRRNWIAARWSCASAIMARDWRPARRRRCSRNFIAAQARGPAARDWDCPSCRALRGRIGARSRRRTIPAGGAVFTIRIPVETGEKPA